MADRMSVDDSVASVGAAALSGGCFGDPKSSARRSWRREMELPATPASLSDGGSSVRSRELLVLVLVSGRRAGAGSGLGGGSGAAGGSGIVVSRGAESR